MASVLGIDPGLSGGLVFIGPDGVLREPMPVTKAEQNDVDACELARLLRSWRPGHAYIEKVGARPKQGVSSMFRFGCGFGTVLGVLAALEIPLTQVRPQEWQRVMLSGMGKGDPKGNALVRAKQLWPAERWLATPRSKVSHSGMIDAALIAEFGRRQQLGQ